MARGIARLTKNRIHSRGRKAKHKTVSGIGHEFLIDAAARRQKWIDHSQNRSTSSSPPRISRPSATCTAVHGTRGSRPPTTSAPCRPPASRNPQSQSRKSNAATWPVPPPPPPPPQPPKRNLPKPRKTPAPLMQCSTGESARLASKYLTPDLLV